MALPFGKGDVMQVLGERFLTLGEASDQLGCQAWKLRQCFARGLHPEPPRAGRYRLIAQSQLPVLRRILEQNGYIGEGK